MTSDPRSEFSWRERALISEALAEELLKNPPGLAEAQADNAALAAQLAQVRDLAETARSLALMLNCGCDDHALQDGIMDALTEILGPLPGDALAAAEAAPAGE